MKLHFDWKTIVCILLAAAILTSCSAPATPAAQPAPTTTPTPDLGKVEVTNDGDQIKIGEIGKTTVYTFTYKKTSNDVEIVRKVNNAQEKDNDFRVCGLSTFIIGPTGSAILGQEYFHTCQLNLFGALQAKVYDDRLQVLYDKAKYEEK